MRWPTFFAFCAMLALSCFATACSCDGNRCWELSSLEPERALTTVEDFVHEDPTPTFRPIDFVGRWVDTESSECAYGAEVHDGDILELFGADLDGDGTADREHLFVIYGLAPAPIMLDPHTAELLGEYVGGRILDGRLHYDGILSMHFRVWFADTGDELAIEYAKVSN